MRARRGPAGFGLRVVLFYLPFVWLATGSNAHGADAPRHHPEKVQHLVNSLKDQLAVSQEVTIAIVPTNALLVSVESSKDRDDAFLLMFENGFLDGLDEDELIAVIAHELGHVWIFTHHPYLQTEQLANEIAMRVVTRESLRRAYQKVWERAGTKGTLARFLGE
jgi:hypothetical protein